MTTYNKLVRDEIIGHIEEKGLPVEFHVANGPEYEEKLREKLHEEVHEFMCAEHPASAEEELADVLEVVYALAALLGHTEDSINAVRREKTQKKGAFVRRHILEKAELGGVHCHRR